jgi:hypothetical protein
MCGLTPYNRSFFNLRYSTPEQGQGDTIRRQLEKTRKYAEEHGLALAESLPPDAIAHLKLDIERGEQQVKKLIDTLLTLPSDAIKARIQKTEADTKAKRQELTAKSEALEGLRSRNRDLLDDIDYSKLAEATDYETRAKLQQEIRRKVSRIDLHFGKFPKQILSLADGRTDRVMSPPGEIAAVVQFCNGATRAIVMDGDKDQLVTGQEAIEDGELVIELDDEGM